MQSVQRNNMEDYCKYSTFNDSKRTVPTKKYDGMWMANKTHEAGGVHETIQGSRASRQISYKHKAASRGGQ